MLAPTGSALHDGARSRRARRRLLRHLGCAAFGIASLLTVIPAHAAGTESAHFVVHPGAWTHTGIHLATGQGASISATGGLYFNTDGPKAAWGPGGYYHLGFQAYDLKAKVAKQIVDIGADGFISATQPGELLVGAGYAYEPNPKDAGTMGGKFDVTVTSAAIGEVAPVGGEPAWAAGALVGLGSAAAGVAAGMADGGGTRAPGARGACAAEEDRFAAASASAHVLQTALQQMNSLRAALEEQRENAREGAFASGAYWTALAAGGVYASATGGLAATAAGEVAKRLIESATKAFGQELMNQVTAYCLDQNISLENLMLQTAGIQVYQPGSAAVGAGGASGQALAEVIRNSIVNIEYSKLVSSMAARDAQALVEGGPVSAAVKAGIQSELAQPIADMVGNVISVLNMGYGVWSASQTLKAFDAQIAAVRDRQSALEAKIDSAMQEMALARAALNHCQQLHAGAA